MQKYPPITQAELPPYPVHIGFHRHHTDDKKLNDEYQTLSTQKPALRHAAGREFEVDE